MDEVINNVWIGNIRDVQQESTSHVDAIITTCQTNVEDNVSTTNYHHHPLSDGPPPSDAHDPGVFDYERFEKIVEQLSTYIENETPVLVHCHAGKSRSAMSVVAALTRTHGMSFNEAFETVSSARTGGINPSAGMREFAEQYAKRSTQTKIQRRKDMTEETTRDSSRESNDAREEIACELQTAYQSLDRVIEISEEHDVLTRVERENITVPMGRIKSVRNNFEDCPAEKSDQ